MQDYQDGADEAGSGEGGDEAAAKAAKVVKALKAVKVTKERPVSALEPPAKAARRTHATRRGGQPKAKLAAKLAARGKRKLAARGKAEDEREEGAEEEGAEEEGAEEGNARIAEIAETLDSPEEERAVASRPPRPPPLWTRRRPRRCSRSACSLG